MLYSGFLENVAMPTVSMLTKSQFWHAYRQMLAFEKLDWPAQQQYQWQRALAMATFAYDNVPAYRQQFEQVGLVPGDLRSPEDWQRVPITTKAMIQRNFPDRITSQNSDTSDWQYVSTRGTADRLMVIHDFHKRDMVRASAVRTMRLSGDYRLGQVSAEIPPNICNIVCGDEGQAIEGVWAHLVKSVRNKQLTDKRTVSDLRGLIERGWIFRRRTYPPFGAMGTHIASEKLADYVNRIREDRPQILKALPTYLLEIARHVVRNNLAPLPVGAVKPMGSSASPRMRDIIRSGFAGPFREDYGSAEFGDMACDRGVNDGSLHIYMDLFLIETVRNQKPAADGELGVVLITDLSNKAMPFLRYQIGDVGRITHHGDQGPTLSIEGRLQDTLVTAQGRIITNDLVMDKIYACDDVDDFQLIEKRPGVYELVLVAVQGQSPDLKKIAADMAHFIGEGATVTPVSAVTIRAEESGKFRFVKSCTYERLL